MMKTKSHVRFLNRIKHYNADIEAVDIFKSLMNSKEFSESGTRIFNYADKKKHPTLSSRGNTSAGQETALNHLKSTLYSSFMKDLHEDASIYFREILKSAILNKKNINEDNIKRILGSSNKKYSGKEILSAGSWDKIAELISGDVFRALENERSTSTLINGMNNKLGLNVSESAISDALPYFEIRHLLVHSDGCADDEFCNNHPDFGAKPGEKIDLDYNLISAAHSAITKLITEFDEKIVASKVIDASGMQP